jgi:hypothetical protein
MQLKLEQENRHAPPPLYHLGDVVIAHITGDRVSGRFVPGADFAMVQDLFREFEAAVNQQLFTQVDELGAAIDALGLQLSNLDGSQVLDVHDVQIMGDGFTCRIETRRPANGFTR